LLARDAKVNERALAALSGEGLPYKEWLAVSNLLLGLRSPQLFVETFNRVHISYAFSIVDQLLPEFGTAGRDGLSGYIDNGFRGFPPGYPPACIYDFVDFGLQRPPGAVLLANGPNPSRYLRIPINEARIGTRPGYSRGWTFDYYHYGYEKEFLAGLSGYAVDRLGRMINARANIKWRGPRLKVVPNDVHLPTLKFNKNLEFDDAFHEWFDKLPDLDAMDKLKTRGI